MNINNNINIEAQDSKYIIITTNTDNYDHTLNVIDSIVSTLVDYKLGRRKTESTIKLWSNGVGFNFINSNELIAIVSKELLTPRITSY